MNIPKFEIKEKNNNMILCTIFCIMIPVLIGVLIYEIRLLISKYKKNVFTLHCDNGDCTGEEMTDV